MASEWPGVVVSGCYQSLGPFVSELGPGNFPHLWSFGHFSAMSSLLMSDFYVTFVMFLPVFVPYLGNIVFMF